VPAAGAVLSALFPLSSRPGLVDLRAISVLVFFTSDLWAPLRLAERVLLAERDLEVRGV
jgi:hypothetical protein